MRVSKVLGFALLSALMSSTAIAQEMGGAMGPGSDYGYEPEPGPTYSGRTYPGNSFNYFGDASGSYAGTDKTASYCAQRHPSYDPRSGTYMTYDGRRRPC